MERLHNELHIYISNLKLLKDVITNNDIRMKINDDFKILIGCDTIQDIINRYCLKFNDEEVYKINLMDIPNSIDDLKILLYNIIVLKMYDLKLDDLRRMCNDYVNIEELTDCYEIKRYDEYYYSLYIYFRDTCLRLIPKRNLYIELLIKDLNRNININDNDNIHELKRKLYNMDHKPYIDDLIKYYKLLNKDIPTSI